MGETSIGKWLALTVLYGAAFAAGIGFRGSEAPETPSAAIILGEDPLAAIIRSTGRFCSRLTKTEQLISRSGRKSYRVTCVQANESVIIYSVKIDLTKQSPRPVSN